MTRALLSLSLTLPGIWACQDGSAREIGRLQNAFSSPEALGRAVVMAIAERDRPALESYLVTRDEHRDLLWDALPERTYFSFQYARVLNERGTSKAITRALERYGGMRLQFVGIRFAEAPETYDDFVLHRGAELRVRDRKSGEEGAIQVLDVVLELDDGWKPMHYVE